MTGGIYYRVHWNECGPFTAGNAWSSPMGLDRRPGDMSQSECLCTVTDGRPDPYCDGCGGTGWQDCIRGYSCFSDPSQLAGYFTDPGHGEPRADEPVIVFEGRAAGTGFDGEPCAVPGRVIRTLTWAQFKAETAQAL